MKKTFFSFVAVALLFQVAITVSSCNKEDPTHSVLFDGNGGAPAFTEQIVRKGERVKKPDDPTRSGYAFVAWHRETTTSRMEEWNFDAAVTADMILLARWEVSNYALTFNSDGGSEVNVQNIVHGRSAVKPTDPTRSGYAFDGWFHGDTEWDFETAITASFTLTARWSVAFLVTFSGNGGSSTDAQNVRNGDRATEPEEPTRSGYMFNGWFDGDAEWDFDAIITAPVELAAKWTKLPEYIAINRDLLGGKKVNHAILGLDGIGYFYEFQSENPNIPQKLSIYDKNKNIVELVVIFDEKGLPKNILSEDFTITLGNYVANRFDAVVMTKEGESQIFENIETNITWSEYISNIGATDGISQSAAIQRLFLISPNALKWVNAGVSAINCTLSVATANILGLINCGFDLGEAFGLWESPQWLNDIKFLQNFMNLATCGVDYWKCFESVVDLVSYQGETRTNSARNNIQAGAVIILETGDGKAIHVGGPGVYVAGYEYKQLNNNTNQTVVVAKLWKNGVAQNLTTGVNNAYAYSVHVSGNDVYVAGYERNAENRGIAKLWKNGVAQNLTDGTAHAVARSVFVSGNNVYVAGNEGGVARLWRNGVKQDLLIINSEAHSVFVSGNDVYAAGYEIDLYSRKYLALLWKNGTLQSLQNYGGPATHAHSVYVSGGDVYVVGTQRGDYGGSNARLWKNGVVQTKGLTPRYFDFIEGSDGEYVNSIFVSGNDVYVAGSNSFRLTSPVAILWKNGVMQRLSNNGSASSVFVSGSDVYVAGGIGNMAVLWVNGVPLGLSDETRTAVASSVFVVQ